GEVDDRLGDVPRPPAVARQLPARPRMRSPEAGAAAELDGAVRPVRLITLSGAVTPGGRAGESVGIGARRADPLEAVRWARVRRAVAAFGGIAGARRRAAHGRA